MSSPTARLSQSPQAKRLKSDQPTSPTRAPPRTDADEPEVIQIDDDTPSPRQSRSMKTPPRDEQEPCLNSPTRRSRRDSAMLVSPTGAASPSPRRTDKRESHSKESPGRKSRADIALRSPLRSPIRSPARGRRTPDVIVLTPRKSDRLNTDEGTSNSTSASPTRRERTASAHDDSTPLNPPIPDERESRSKESPERVSRADYPMMLPSAATATATISPTSPTRPAREPSPAATPSSTKRPKKRRTENDLLLAAAELAAADSFTAPTSRAETSQSTPSGPSTSDADEILSTPRRSGRSVGDETKATPRSLSESAAARAQAVTIPTAASRNIATSRNTTAKQPVKMVTKIMQTEVPYDFPSPAEDSLRPLASEYAGAVSCAVDEDVDEAAFDFAAPGTPPSARRERANDAAASVPAANATPRTAPARRKQPDDAKADSTDSPTPRTLSGRKAKKASVGNDEAAASPNAFATPRTLPHRKKSPITTPRTLPHRTAKSKAAQDGDETASSRDRSESRDKDSEKDGDSDNEGKRKRKEHEEAKKAWRDKTANVAKTADYDKLLGMMKKLEKNLGPFRRLYPEHPLVKENHLMLKRIEKGMKEETYKEWDDKAAASGSTTSCFTNYIIAVEEREMGTAGWDAPGKKALLKWEGYPVGSWEDASALTNDNGEHREMQLRLARLDTIEHFLRCQIGNNEEFKKQYPNRYPEVEVGEGDGGYITKARSHYISKLRAIEYYFNKINEKCGMPPVYVEDWTDLEESYEGLAKLIYIQTSLLSAKVKKLMKNRSRNLEHIKCGATCMQGKKPCSYAKGKPVCCFQNRMMELDENDVPHFMEKEGRPKRLVNFRVECNEHCGCDADLCMNRVVQRGRQHALCIFRDRAKEWSLRCVSEIEKDEFVGEYTGRIILGSSHGRAQQYDYTLTYKVPDTTQTLTVAGFKCGNETRFISHSCFPDLYCEMTVVERNGVYNNRVAMRALRKTVAGQELTFDYFPDETLEVGVSVYRKMFPKGCLCFAPTCRFSWEQMLEHIRLHGDETSDDDSSEESSDSDEEQMTPRRTRLSNAMGGKESGSTPIIKELENEDEEEEDMMNDGPAEEEGAPGCSGWSDSKARSEQKKRKLDSDDMSSGRVAKQIKASEKASTSKPQGAPAWADSEDEEDEDYELPKHLQDKKSKE